MIKDLTEKCYLELRDNAVGFPNVMSNEITLVHCVAIPILTRFAKGVADSEPAPRPQKDLIEKYRLEFVEQYGGLDGPLNAMAINAILTRFAKGVADSEPADDVEKGGGRCPECGFLSELPNPHSAKCSQYKVVFPTPEMTEHKAATDDWIERKKGYCERIISSDNARLDELAIPKRAKIEAREYLSLIARIESQQAEIERLRGLVFSCELGDECRDMAERVLNCDYGKPQPDDYRLRRKTYQDLCYLLDRVGNVNNSAKVRAALEKCKEVGI